MNSSPLLKRTAGAGLKAAVIFDDLEMAAEATSLISRAATAAGEAAPCKIQSLPIHALQQAASGNAAILETEDSQLIVFALRDALWMPPWLLEWLETWAAHRQLENAAIVALGTGWHSRLSAPTLQKLRKIAKDWNLGCFCDGGESGIGDTPEYFSTHPSASMPSPWLPQSSKRFSQPRDWGINE